MNYLFLAIILLVALFITLIGFKKYVYFLSIGYAFSMIFGSVAIFIIIEVSQHGYSNMLYLLIIQCLLFIAYGIRLASFLIYREVKSTSYRRILNDEIENRKKMSLLIKLIIWIVVSILYTALLSPVLFRHLNKANDYILPLIGVSISLSGLIIETVADLTKSKQKKINPNMIVTKGIYKMCRFPNYFGEIIFWSGVYIANVSSYKGIAQWIITTSGYIAIILIMINSARRLEIKQNNRYKDNLEYQKYVNKTPILIPLIPIYHLTKNKKNKC